IVEVTASHKANWVERVRLAKGPTTQEISVNLADEPPSEVAGPVGPSPSARPVLTPKSEPEGNSREVFGMVLVGAGAGAVVLGTVYGLRAFAKKEEVEGRCPAGNCPTPDDQSAAQKADEEQGTAAIVSTVAFVGAAAALAGGAYLLLTPSSNRSAPSVRIAPAVFS